MKTAPKLLLVFVLCQSAFASSEHSRYLRIVEVADVQIIQDLFDFSWYSADDLEAYNAFSCQPTREDPTVLLSDTAGIVPLAAPCNVCHCQPGSFGCSGCQKNYHPEVEVDPNCQACGTNQNGCMQVTGACCTLCTQDLGCGCKVGGYCTR